MKFLTTLILLGLSNSVLSGGDTNCGPLQSNYLSLLQVCQYLVDESLKTLNSKWIVENNFDIGCKKYFSL
jgi:hypothetical protein